MKIFLFTILLMGIQIPSWADSGMAPFWLYQTADGKFLAKMSDQAEQDEYTGATPGIVKSKFLMYKMLNGSIPKKQTFVTTALCESYRNEPRSIRCGTGGGPFSGAVYTLTSGYTFEAAGKGRLKPKIIAGKNDLTQKQRAMSLIGEYVKSDDYKGSFGLIGFDIFSCVEGCKTMGTPELMIEVSPMGD